MTASKAVILTLVAALVVQLGLYLSLRFSPRPQYILMPFITPAQPEGKLPRTGLHMARYLASAGLLGPTLSLEDVKAGVQALGLQPGLALTSAQRARIQPQLDRALQAQAGIAALRAESRAAEIQLLACRQAIMARLTPAQRAALRRTLESSGGPR